MTAPTPTQRKTPEQIAWSIAWNANYDINDEHRDAVQAAIATALKGLAEDLAQAQQERDESDHNHAADIVQLVREVQHWRQRAEGCG